MLLIRSQDTSNDYPQNMFSGKQKKNKILDTLLNCRYAVGSSLLSKQTIHM